MTAPTTTASRRADYAFWGVFAALVLLALRRPAPTLLSSALWMILLLWSGLRLSSVPIARPSAPSPPTR